MTKQEIKPTEEQEAIVAATAQGSESLMISAFAGCAKTTSLELLGKKVRGPALALAFNKSIADELRTRFGTNFEVKTMNGLGFGVLRRALPQVAKWEVDERKVGKIISALARQGKLELSSEEWDTIRRLVSSAQNLGYVPEGRHPDVGFWKDLGAEAWLTVDARAASLAHDALRENNEKTRKGLISFDDQVYWPTVFDEAKFPQYPSILVDEAQDLSPLQHAMLAKATGPQSRLMICGDAKQAIYGFRGADSASMAKIQGLRPAWLHRPLTLTFRCPKLVVERQQVHAPGFRAWPGNAEGRVERLEKWNWEGVEVLLPNDASRLAVLCRNNAPLFALAFRLLRKGIGVVMLGRDIGKGLKALVKKIAGKETMGISAFLGKLAEWRDGEVEIAEVAGKTGEDEVIRSVEAAKIDAIWDKFDCLVAIAEGAGTKDSAELCAAIDGCFEREKGTVTLASIHKSKGLEWDVVLHLDPWRIPSKQALRAAGKGDQRQLEQEWNLKYVCETRSKHTLIEADLEDFEAQ